MKPNYSPQELEDRAEQAYASRLRFRQTILGGVGAAMIFGLVSAICTRLVPMAIEAIHAGGFMAALGPVSGLLAVAAVGLGCIYIGSQLLSKVITIEQEGQARKIHEAAQGKEKDIPTLKPEIEKPVTIFPGTAAIQATQADQEQTATAKTATATDSPALTIQADSAQWMDKMQPTQGRTETMDEAKTADQAWAAKLTLDSDPQATAARA